MPLTYKCDLLRGQHGPKSIMRESLKCSENYESFIA